MDVTWLTLFIPAVIVTALSLALVATRRVRRDASFTSDQRYAQLWLIWTLPIVGAALVLSMLHDEPRADPTKDPPDRHRSS